MRFPLDTRDDAPAAHGREAAIGRLITRALTRPTNVLPSAALIAVGIGTGLWLVAVAGVAVYATLAVTTFKDPREARKALGLPAERAVLSAASAAPELRNPEIRRRYTALQEEYRQVSAAVDASPVPLPEVDVETAGLMDDVGALCRRADAISDYLGSVDERHLRDELARAERDLAVAGEDTAPALIETVAALTRQLDTITQMGGRLRQFDVQMRQVASNLGAIRGEIARIAIDSEADNSGELMRNIGSARTMVSALSEAIGETTGAQVARAQSA